MITKHTIAILACSAWLACNSAHAQEEETEDPIEAIIRAFQHRNPSEGAEEEEENEIIVVLEPEENKEPASPATEPEESTEEAVDITIDLGTDKDEALEKPMEEEPSEQVATSEAPPTIERNEEPASKPVLVTGKPPVDPDLIEESAEPEAEAEVEIAGTAIDIHDDTIDLADVPVIANEDSEQLEEAPPEPKPGLNVRVEHIQSGKGELDTKRVHLRAPFPAKPLSPPPAGWRLETSKKAPPFKREIELTPGRTITLTIHPHLLVPDTESTPQCAVPEPGFQASQGYQQSDTIPGVLSQSIHRLEEDSQQLGTAIDLLQQLIVSLPNAENSSAPAKQ